jgi:hypothetical protein
MDLLQVYKKETLWYGMVFIENLIDVANGLYEEGYINWRQGAEALGYNCNLLESLEV